MSCAILLQTVDIEVHHSDITMASRNSHDLQCLTIDHLQKLAAERMDKQTRDYYNEGADSGTFSQLALTH
jgi:hypothetical protein